MSSYDSLRNWLSRLKLSAHSPNDASNRRIKTPTKIDVIEPMGNDGIHLSIDRPLPTASKQEYRTDPAIDALSRPPTDTELDTIAWGQRLSGPIESASATHSDIESRHSSGRTSPTDIDDRRAVAHLAPSIKHPYMNRWRTAACCIAFFIQGLNDSAPGALLPYMERHYNIKYAIVSLIFVANAVGFIIAAPFCHMLNNRFGRAKVLSGCTALNILAYVALICRPPFAVVVVAFLFLGRY